MSVRPTTHPLSSVQRDIWFDQILHPDVPLYNIGGYLRIDGPVDPAIFEQAVRQVVRENDALRIILHEGDPVPMQEFREDVQFDVPFLDFSEEDNAMQKAVEWLQQVFVKPFQLYGALLFRYALVKLTFRIIR